VPPFFLVIVLFLGLQRIVPPDDGLLMFGTVFGLILWPFYARPVRAKAQQVAGESYVDAARAAGATPGRLLSRHVIPNSFFPALAQVPVDVYNIFFVLTVFPFIGCFGGGANQFFEPISALPAPTYPEWGNMLAQGACHGWSPLPELNFWWMYAFPALVVLVFGIAVALLCDGAERLLAAQRPT
jgi:peptide/nickel transport system permease protein